MTRRKRTPPPPPPAHVRFNIPQSLQHLSALSASLARSADAPIEGTNSEIVAAAQARVGVADATRRVVGSGYDEVGSVSGIGKGKTKGKGKAKKELRWKTKEHVFPEEQTWLKPVETSRRSALGHATFMRRKSLVGRVDGTERGEEREATDMVGEVEGNGVGDGDVVVQTQMQRQPLPLPPPPSAVRGSTLQVKMDHRVQQSRFVRSTSTTNTATAMQQDELAVNQSGSRKKQRVNFTERHQREFPTDQTWLRAQPEGSVKRTLPKFSSEIEARRAAIIAQLRQTHSPLEIIGADDVGGGDAAATAGGGGGGSGPVRPPPGYGAAPPYQQQWQQQYDQGNGLQGSPSDANNNQQHLAALIAQKRAENLANGQSQRLLGLKNEHQRKRSENGQGVSLTWNRGAYPPVGPQSLSRHGHNHGQGPWLAPRARSPHMQIQRQQPLVGRQMVQLGERAMAVGGRLSTSTNSTTAAGRAVEPLQGLAEAARAVMDSSRLGSGSLDGIVGAAAAAAGAVQGDDTDEDAPGEDDMLDQSVLDSGAVDAAATGTGIRTVVQSAGDPSTPTAAATALPNRLVDPGDLRSLFSSPGPSPGPSSRALSVPVDAGRKGNAENARHDHAGHENAGAGGDWGGGMEGEVDSPMQASPSVRLLLALANDTPPPRPPSPPAAAVTKKVGLERAGMATGSGLDGGAGPHRRTRNGLALKG